MPKDVKPHQLYKQVPGSAVTNTFSAGSWVSSVPTGAGWLGLEVAFAPASLGGAVHRDYIDLAGWSMQELTSFFKGFDIQKQNAPLDNTGNVAVLWEFDFITTRAITDAELSNFENQPGFLGSTLNLQELIYAEKRTYAANAQVVGTFIITDTETSGSGNPTAMDKLHWTRYYVFGVAATNTCQILPANLVVQTVTAKEKDLVWMERLRRSYILQDPADQAGL